MLILDPMPINFKTLSTIKNILLKATKHRRKKKRLQTRKEKKNTKRPTNGEDT